VIHWKEGPHSEVWLGTATSEIAAYISGAAARLSPWSDSQLSLDKCPPTRSSRRKLEYIKNKSRGAVIYPAPLNFSGGSDNLNHLRLTAAHQQYLLPMLNISQAYLDSTFNITSNPMCAL
jgi:hypothetical protein